MSCIWCQHFYTQVLVKYEIFVGGKDITFKIINQMGKYHLLICIFELVLA